MIKNLSIQINQLQKKVEEINNLISEKIKQPFRIRWRDLMGGQITAFFEEELLEEDKNFILKTLKENFGKLGRKEFKGNKFLVYLNERESDG
jgi:hypothetical protein